MAVVSMNNLLEAGVHFGHQTKRWNPKMKEYIFTSRNDIYIIDLQKTAKKIDEAYVALNKIAVNGGKVLFVGTRKQASEATKEEAIRSNSYYICERWLGGTLTNFKTIRNRVRRIEEIEKMEKDGTFEVLPKKEVIGLKKEYDKLNNLLCGIRDMKRLPSAMFIVDPTKEDIAIKEARKLNIPVFGIVDTNCDPDMVDFVIPANDDAIRAVKLIIGVMANAVVEAQGGKMIDFTAGSVKEENSEEIMQKALETVKGKDDRRPRFDRNKRFGDRKPFNRNGNYQDRNNNGTNNGSNGGNYQDRNNNGTNNGSNSGNYQDRNNNGNYVNRTGNGNSNGNYQDRTNNGNYVNRTGNGSNSGNYQDRNNSGKPYVKFEDKKVEKTVEVQQPKPEVKEIIVAKEEKASVDFTKMTVTELRNMAKGKEVKGYSVMKKAELIDALK